MVNTYCYYLSNKSIKAAASDQALLSYPKHGKIYIYIYMSVSRDVGEM